jgi:hypothetical protein
LTYLDNRWTDNKKKTAGRALTIALPAVFLL